MKKIGKYKIASIICFIIAVPCLILLNTTSVGYCDKYGFELIVAVISGLIFLTLDIISQKK